MMFARQKHCLSGSLALLLAVLSTNLLADSAFSSSQDTSCHGETVRGEPYVVCMTYSTAGKEIRAELRGEQITTHIDSIRVCPSPSARIRDAILWMPDHGHGSAPTRLSLEADDCTIVSNVEFSMTGYWQIKLRFADNDRAIIAVDVD